ncbi:MAG: TonB-dependent receptor [Ignavibacteriaceae bacterium]
MVFLSRNKSLILFLFFIIIFSAKFYAQTGDITGYVLDASNNSPLWGTTIMIKGTSMGTNTNEKGFFQLLKVPAKRLTLIFSYIGYESDTVSVKVTNAQIVNLNIKMNPQSIKGKEVVITAQLRGQESAINRQLTSNNIVNIVSADKIQELPDANVAESLGRLSGIAVERDAGEGSLIVVRGLSPQFTNIEINGEKIPATDPITRSVDLSMISQDVLSSIEVFKAITPDQDGGTIGGTVNLITMNAPDKLRFDLRAQDGYGSLPNDYGQYKFDLSLSNRFFDKKLGVFVAGSIQRENRSSNDLTGDYISSGANLNPIVQVANINLQDDFQIRNRYSTGINLDYKLDNGTIWFHNFLSGYDRSEVKRRKRYRLDTFTTVYDITNSTTDQTLNLNSLGVNYTVSNLILDAQGSYSNTRQEIPYSNYSRFIENGAFKNGIILNQGPEVIPSFAFNNLANTWFQYGTFDPQEINDKDYSGKIDLKLPVNWGEDVSGFFKGGFKYRDESRVRNITEYRTDYAVVDSIGMLSPNQYQMWQKHILISNFIDPGFTVNNFLNGQYTFGPGLNSEMLNTFYQTNSSRYALNRLISLDTYTAGEKVTALYIMGEFNLFKKIMILPGLRYEQTSTDYNGFVGTLTGTLGQTGIVIDSIGGQNYEDYLPMFHIRYKMFDDFDIRLAYTQSLSRPDYFNLVPYQLIDQENKAITQGNPNLKHIQAINYDLFFSYYNKFGLYTLGLFYKKLNNIDYTFESRVASGQYQGYTLTQPVNSPEAKVYGIELDAQTNLTFLPAPFDGIIIGANASRIYSQTFFPLFVIGPRSTLPPYAPIIINTFREGRMPGQANWIANFTVGYERGGFSGRVSINYQSDILETVGNTSILDGYSKAYTRIDISLSQKIMNRISLFVDGNNVTNLSEGSYLGTEAYPTSIQIYGWTVDAGIRYKF